MMTSVDNIKVAIRIRPLIPTEKEKKLHVQWGVQGNNIYQIDDHGQKYGEVFSFDHIFCMDKSNFEIYEDIVNDFVDSSLKGLNSTIFAYGQTSSGKTYTMMGDDYNIGIMSLAIESIFNSICECEGRNFLLRVSYIEIYNEKIKDLLDPTNKDIKIREFYAGTVGLQNIKEEIVTTREQVYECLRTGAIHKQMAATNMNERSSRSHTIFKIIIESAEIYNSEDEKGPVQISNLNFVDLAGSERVAQTKATGVRLKEGGHINKSLSALGLVIRQLSDGQDYVNFRDSKLTRLLQDSLGGNSKTLIIATITLASVEDTNSTLSFAQRAKAVKNKPTINQVMTDAVRSKVYAQLNAQLQQSLDEQLRVNENLKRSGEDSKKKLLHLQEKMQMLQTFQHGKSAKSINTPRRRHTVAYSQSNQSFLKNLDTKENNVPIRNSMNLHSGTNRHSTKIVNESTELLLPTIFEEDVIQQKEPSTPREVLKTRLSRLEKEYNELVTYTRDETCIFNQTAIKAEELEKQLKNSEQRLAALENQQKSDVEILVSSLKSKFKIREDELVDRISKLEMKIYEIEPSEKDKIAFILEPSELKCIRDQLLNLQDILNNSTFEKDENQQEIKTKRILKKFKSKIFTSKKMIENEIFKQLNNFSSLNEKVNEPVELPNELHSFNELLNELTSFENDMSQELKKNGKDYVADLKTLLTVYESVLKKNICIKKCSETVLMLQEQSKLNYELHSKEVNYLKNELKLKDAAIENFKTDHELQTNRMEQILTLFKSKVSQSKDVIEREIKKQIHCFNNVSEKLDEPIVFPDELNDFDALLNDLSAFKEDISSDLIESSKNDLKYLVQIYESLLKKNELIERYSEKNFHQEQTKMNNVELNKEICDLKNKIAEKDSVICKLENEIDVVTEERKNVTAELDNSNKLVEAYTHKFELYEKTSNINEIRLQRHKEWLNRAREEAAELKKQKELDKQEFEGHINDYRHLLDNARTHNNKIRVAADEEKEQLKCIISQLENEMEKLRDSINANKKQMKEDSQLIQSLKTKEVTEHSIFENNLHSLTKQLELIVEHLNSGQKTLLSLKHSPDEREYYKNVTKSLKNNSVSVKHLLKLLLEQKLGDLEDINSISMVVNEGYSIVKEYYTMEKCFLESKIHEIDSSNKAYLEEIISLKEKRDYCQCEIMKTEMLKLRELHRSQETLIAELKRKHSSQMKEIIDLQKQLNEEQYKNKKTDVQHNRLDVYRGNEQVVSVQRRDSEIQCNLDKEALEILQNKYKTMKIVCQRRKEELSSLRKRIAQQST